MSKNCQTYRMTCQNDQYWGCRNWVGLSAGQTVLHYSSLYILLLGKLGPKRFLQANWAPEIRVPEKWAPGIIYAADWGLGKLGHNFAMGQFTRAPICRGPICLEPYILQDSTVVLTPLQIQTPCFSPPNSPIFALLELFMGSLRILSVPTVAK